MLDNLNYIVETLPGKIDLLALHALYPERYPYYLESSAAAPQHEQPQSPSSAQYDLLFAFPQDILVKQVNQSVQLNNSALSHNDFLIQFDKLWRSHRISDTDHVLPFRGGWFVYLGYELVNEIEPSLNLKRYDPQLPIALAARIPCAIIYSIKNNQTYVLTEKGYEHYLRQILQDIAELPRAATKEVAEGLYSVKEEDAALYQSSIQKVLHYIKEGDVFQVNLSRQWDAEFSADVDPVSLFRRLRRTNPAPFSALLRINDSAVISSSPERLVRTRIDTIETRPIAGTRPRGTNDHTDQVLREELLSHFKERAEHIMLIDLERNDLGRICIPGSITVSELMSLESYAHVHHIVSNVCGKLRAGTTPGEIIAALFPGGTITGCPKVRCMQIIDELEHVARSAYTGSLGYINHNGDMDLNILIRTLIQHNNRVRFRAGGGIVADSIPDKEIDETRAKAKGMLLAVQGS